MFSCQSLFCNNEHISWDHTETLEGVWPSCFAYTDTSIFLWSSFILCWVSESACVTMNQIGWSDAFGMEESKLILVHHDVDNEAVSRDYIYEVKKKCASKHELMTSI